MTFETSEKTADERIVTREESYIPHLDGLRAVALLGVLLYHFEIGPMRGGYTGVDMFFVLSGFLMTRNIRGRIQSGQFNLTRFYVSRFWRLYPSSLFTSVLVLISAYVVFPPELQKRTLASAFSSALMCSNALFCTEIGGYFDAGAITKPLLHTWSLSLEEQFYFLWPLILVATTLSSPLQDPRGSFVERQFCITLVSVAAVSFGAAVAFSRPAAYPVFAWFHLPTRAFEFVAGALAYKVFDPLPNRPLLQSFLSAVGLALIFGSFVLLNRDGPDLHGTGGVKNPVSFPGWATLPPCVGAVLAIITPRSIFAGDHLLSTPAVRYVGKISYSAYLIHWPVWVFLVFLTDDRTLGPLALLATWILGQLLFKYVEKPSRTKSRGRGVGLGLVVFSFIACSTGLLSRGRTQSRDHGHTRNLDTSCNRVDMSPLHEIAYNVTPVTKGAHKMRLNETDWIQGSTCQFRIHRPSEADLATVRSPRVVFVADSFGTVGRALGDALSHGYALGMHSPGCFQYFAEDNLEALGLDPQCYEANKCARHLVYHLPRPTTVLFMFRWELVACEGLEPGKCSPYNNFVAWLPKVVNAGHRVIVVSSPPRATKDGRPYDPRRCMDRQRITRRTVCPAAGPPDPAAIAWGRWLKRQTARIRGVQFFDLSSVFCKKGNPQSCLAVYCGEHLYMDHRGHLSDLGLGFLVPHLRKLVT